LIKAMTTQTLTLEFPDGGTLDISLTGEDRYGLNRIYSPPQYISVIENGKPRVVDEITPEEADQYLGTYMKYR